MSDIDIRVRGHAGRITLKRPKALNALTYDMLRAIEAAVDAWRADTAVALVVIDAEGDKAFCAGGDIADLYRTGMAGDFAYGQQFWRDEYRLNAKLAGYSKPIVSFLQGFTMGGGVGIGCHASHRIVGETSRIAMPECGIGLVPDVGGSLLLARAPARLGEYLGITGTRMGPGDAIHVGFADHYLPEAHWPDTIAALCDTGNAPAPASEPPPEAPLAEKGAAIAEIFETHGRDLPAIRDALAKIDPDAAKALDRNAPLSMACTLEILARVRAAPTMANALGQEYRFTARAMEHGDFLEGIRAAIIDKDRNPRWKHVLGGVTEAQVHAMLAPLEKEFAP